jgi:vitamin B12/bleomycin/antimicrobial peptide transport system ATP-binding/permease protein
MTKLNTFLKDLWRLTKPYWFSEERWAARGLLALIIALNLGLVYIEVLLNQWQNGFYNTLENKDITGFYQALWRFSGIAAAFIIATVYQLYLNQMLQIRWRRWLTDVYLKDWIGERTYYRLQLAGGDTATDNPDQRIAEDLALFVDRTLNLTLGFMSAVVTLFSFLTILWGLSGAVSFTLGGSTYRIEGYMVWVALIYAIAGTWLIHRIGHPLVPLNFEQQKVEANFRFSLMRFRENAEGIALHRGEAGETRNLRERFSAVAHNWWAIMKRQKKLMWFRSGYSQIAVIFPYIVQAPRFFSGQIKLGDLMQTASAFEKVLEALSWFVTAYTQLAAWKATVDRLTSFQAAMARTSATNQQPGITTAVEGNAVSGDNIELKLPNGNTLVAPFSLTLAQGTSVLITGASGSGKSTLFRALAGLWPWGRGTVHLPQGQRVLFLPQKPYLIIGTLRAQLCYPDAADRYSDAELKRVLADCDLPQLAERLDEEQHWAQQLSGGEQQRIAFARALLQKPDWLFMDEGTASMDEASEARLYALLRTQLPNTTVISIGHRPALIPLHQRRIELQRDSGVSRVVFA